MKRIGVMIGTFFGIGFLPIAPGTWASAAVALLVYFTPLASAPFLLMAAITMLVYVVGVPAAALCEKHFAKKDPRPCVIDEVAGQLVGLWFLPHRAVLYLAAFFLFRLFDILKPFPADRSEALPHGFGIMTDDVLAGAYTLVVMVFLRRFVLG